jgi:hypothetical protein
MSRKQLLHSPVSSHSRDQIAWFEAEMVTSGVPTRHFNRPTAERDLDDTLS